MIQQQNTSPYFKKSTDNIDWIYSDGSQDSEGNTGAGWAIFQWKKNLVHTGFGCCGIWQEVAGAEAIYI